MLPSADKGDSGPGSGNSDGNSGGGSDPPLPGPSIGEQGFVSGVGDDPGGGGGGTIKDIIIHGSSDISCCSDPPSHFTSASSDGAGLGYDNGTPNYPLSQECQSEPAALTSSVLSSADKGDSGPGSGNNDGNSGGGSDPPLPGPSIGEQGFVSGVGDVPGSGGTIKGVIIWGAGDDPGTFKGIFSGGSDPGFCSWADLEGFHDHNGGGAKGPIRLHSAPCA